MEIITWTLMTQTPDGKGMSTYGTYPSKREAVQAMESIRMPKTPVHRDGNTFVFQPRKG